MISNNTINIIDMIIGEIRNDAPVSSGALRKSISYTIQKDGNNFIINIKMNGYGIFQDQGVDGTKKSWGSPFKFNKMPPSSLLDKWVVKKGIAPRNAAGQFISRKGLNFAIARSIMENGIRPKNFIQPNIDRSIDKLTNSIVNDIWNDFKNKIK